jgi:hypothetical protein
VAFREVSVVEVRVVLGGGLVGVGLRTVAARAGVDRKTARRYVQAAQAAGLSREAGPGALDDALVGVVVGAVRPARPNGHGGSWERLLAREEQIRSWVKGDLSVVKIEELLTRSGCSVPYRTLHRFAVERCGFRVADTTVRVVDGEPGVECQIDFAQMGFLLDAETGKRRRVHALIFTAAYSRHMFVWLTYSQTLAAVLDGCEAAWVFFGGVFKVERAVQYVRGNFWAGETFTDLADAQQRVVAWCAHRAGMRVHGTTAARPAEVFAQVESRCLLGVPAVYDVPTFTRVKVHRDFHVEVARSLYSAPGHLLGQHLEARADGALVKLFHGGQLVSTHPRQRPGGRSTHEQDLPAERAGYAMRDLAKLIATAANHGQNIGIYAERLLDDPLPWTRMRSVYRLLGLVRRYGPVPVEAACARSLELDVVSVTKIASMLARATENDTPALPAAAGSPTGRFARDPAEFVNRGGTQLTLIRGGAATTESETSA